MITLKQAIAAHDTVPTWDNPPEAWADIARVFENNSMWAEAAEAWERARSTSVGHNRRERYKTAAIACRARAQS